MTTIKVQVKDNDPSTIRIANSNLVVGPQGATGPQGEPGLTVIAEATDYPEAIEDVIDTALLTQGAGEATSAKVQSWKVDNGLFPVEFYVSAGTFTGPGGEQVIDHTWSFQHNQEGVAGFPKWGWNWENYFLEPSGRRLFEHNWDFTSIDRNTSYRPFAFLVDCTTNKAEFLYNNVSLISINAGVNTDNVFQFANNEFLFKRPVQLTVDSSHATTVSAVVAPTERFAAITATIGNNKDIFALNFANAATTQTCFVVSGNAGSTLTRFVDAVCTGGVQSRQQSASGDAWNTWTAGGFPISIGQDVSANQTAISRSDTLGTNNVLTISNSNGEVEIQTWLRTLRVGSNPGSSFPVVISGPVTGGALLSMQPSSTANGDIILYGNLPARTGGSTNIGLLQQSLSGGTLQFLVSNTSNTASSMARFDAMVAGASAGDPSYKYTISGVINVAHGLDNSDADAWVLSNSSSIGSNNLLRAATDGTSIVTVYGPLQLNTSLPTASAANSGGIVFNSGKIRVSTGSAWERVASGVVDTGWSVTNYTARKAFDKSTQGLSELVDLVGTLIERLKTVGIIDT